MEKKIIKKLECILIIKTNSRNINKITNTIIKIHSYDNPCILFFDVRVGSKIFTKWITNCIK